MDITNPLRTIAPTVDADVLRVLAATHTGLTGARTADLADRSYAQVRNVLHRLVDHGLVNVERHGNAYSYRLNRQHVVASGVEHIINAVAHIEDRLGREVAAWALPPVAVIMFGSFARRDGDATSDLDLLLIRSDDVDEDDLSWNQQRHRLVRVAERLSGNPTQVVELTTSELGVSRDRGEPMIESVREHGRVLFGPDLRELMGPRGLGIQ